MSQHAVALPLTLTLAPRAGRGWLLASKRHFLHLLQEAEAVLKLGHLPLPVLHGERVRVRGRMAKEHPSDAL